MGAADLTREQLGFVPPTFDLQTLLAIAGDAFDLTGDAAPLGGERDQNLLISTARDEQFVLKVSGRLEDANVVDLQTQALLHLETITPEISVPRMRPSVDGTYSHEITDSDGNAYLARVLTFVSGDMFEDLTRIDLPVLESIGRFQGELCQALSSFEHPAADHFMAWDISNGLVTNDAMWASGRADLKELAGHTRKYLTDSPFNAEHNRRIQVIHNDGHSANVLRSPGTTQVCGVIDFGDMVLAPLVNDLAVAASSFLFTNPDPIAAVVALAKGFNQAIEMTAAEIDLLCDSILARLVLTILLLDFQIANCPENRPSAVVERPSAMTKLTRWLAVDANALTEQLRHNLEGA